MSTDPNQPFRELESTGAKSFSLSDDPPVFVAGEQAELIDAEWRRYIDFACGSGTNALGHHHPAIAKALTSQLESGITHVGPHFHTPAQARFYEALAELLPHHLRRFHPATNGTEATEVALKAAMHATGHHQFLAIEGGYHGRTFGALSVSEAKGRNAALAPFAPNTAFLPFAEHEDQIESALQQAELHMAGRDIAALIIEPIQATAGMRLPAKGYLDALATLALAQGCLLIVDEVFTGFDIRWLWEPTCRKWDSAGDSQVLEASCRLARLHAVCRKQFLVSQTACPGAGSSLAKSSAETCCSFLYN